MKNLIECIPNFSEGQDPKVIAAIAQAIEAVDGVYLLHQDSGFAAHRTVYTFAGEASSVIEAAYQVIAVAHEQIDMRKHQGEHPRIGACDVCPFVPISGISIEELVPLVNALAKRLHREFKIPIHFYEENASSPFRKNLARHRVGNYEALKKRLLSKEWPADLGAEFHPRFGAMVLGVRDFLVAYNINLNTDDALIAQEIAYDLRELGRPMQVVQGKKTFKAGRLKFVKAIGWYIEDFKKAQVSINLTNYKKTPLHEVFETTKEIAEDYQVKVTGSELIGLIPKDALVEAGGFYLANRDATEAEKIQSSIKALGLDELLPFEPQKRILEYCIEAKVDEKRTY
ncbi:MAG: glutamate formimidoyltransferase [Vicingaceae bacterium]